MAKNSHASIVVYGNHEKSELKIENQSPPNLSLGEILIESEYSSMNFKDALAVTGKGRILKRFPLSPGIDVAGKVVASQAQEFGVGESVLVTGCGIGEEISGGFARFVKVKGAVALPIPKGWNLRDSMIAGTAGFTAGLAMLRMEALGQAPDLGPILVTGASGGVGSWATSLFSKNGYSVIALTGKSKATSYLKNLGAHSVVSPENLNLGDRPLESVRYGGAIDNVGGEILCGLLRHIQLWGNIACVGLAASPHIQSTVMPHILRGVSLLGISSANCPMPLRKKVWELLSGCYASEDLRSFQVSEISLAEVPTAAESMMNRHTVGRILVSHQKG